MKRALSSLLVIGLSVGQQAAAYTHPQHQLGAIHHAPTSACLSREKAEAEAMDLVFKSAQRYCRSEGFGWHAASVSDVGRLSCQPCDESHYSCGFSTIALECRKVDRIGGLLDWFSASPRVDAGNP